MPEPLHILVLGSAPHAQDWRAAGHRVTEVTGGRLRAAWRTWRGAGRDADVILEIVGRRAYLSPLWGWLQAPRVVAEDGPGSLLSRLYRPLLYGGTPVVAVATLAALEEAARGERVRVRDAVARSETAKAAGLAAATLGANAIQLIFTIVFTRMLGVTDYGSLAVLVSAFLILLVAGSAVQVAAARETALGNLGDGPRLAGTLSDWARRLGLALLVVGALSALARQPIADLVGVPEHPWGAAGILPMGVLWVGLSLQRGVLQGLHAYAPVAQSLVGESAGRLVFCLMAAAVGAGVTGVYLAQGVTFLAISGWLWLVLRRRLGGPADHERHRLTTLFGENWRPMTALAMMGALQNIDVIVVKHQLGNPRAGSYAAAAVAAKTVVWVAIGIGLHLLPEATRRAAAGLDPRPVLVRALQIAGLVAVPALLIFAIVPRVVLRMAFGEEYTNASSVLAVLGAAMFLLAISYLTVQYLIALGRRGFLWVLGAVAIAEPLVLFSGDYSLLTFALIVLSVQVVATSGLVGLGLRGGAAPA
ncbi:MAG: glycosyltransferase [Solirubrobacterales bacterium]|nr:glycosyltransferase [Solirubrobacterales bacterium]